MLQSVWRLASILLLAALLLGSALTVRLVAPPPTSAATLAISGSFSSQVFEIPQGASVNVPGVYVVVYNYDIEPMQVTMSTAVKIQGTDDLAPPGITVNLATSSVELQPYDPTEPEKSQQTIKVWLDVSQDAVAGVYDVEVNAQGSRDEGGGNIQIVGAAGLRAPLTVTGEASTVTVRTVSPGGDPVTTAIRLSKIIGTGTFEVFYQGGGAIERVRVSPGRFLAVAFGIYGEELARQEFDVGANEDKVVELIVETVYFKSFELVNASGFHAGTSSRLNMKYTITNAYSRVYNVSVKLAVTLDEALLEEIDAWATGGLENGDTEQVYFYVPPEEWQEAVYRFRLRLYVGDALTAETGDEILEVGPPVAGRSWLWIVFVIAGILGIGGLGLLIFFLLKRRKKDEEKPEKAKKGKEAKPGRKIEEPVRKPEPVRRPEPARPVEPVQYEKPPAAEPSRLASVSTLKARMASIGRDQGMGKGVEEEPGAEGEAEEIETGPEARVPDAAPPPPRVEPEPTAARKAEAKVQKPAGSDKPHGQKTGIFSSVTASGKKDLPRPPITQGPTPVKPEDEVQINWPPKSVEPPKKPDDVQINWPPKSAELPKKPSDVQVNWPPKPAEPAKPASFAEAARQRVEAQQRAPAPEEGVPTEEATAEGETSEAESHTARSSFAEAARLRMEARQRATQGGEGGAKPGGSQTEGDSAGESGKGDEPPSSP